MTRRRRNVMRYLERIGRREHALLEACMRERIHAWGADGWALVGKPPRVRIAVLVPRLLSKPANAATTVRLPRELGGHDLDVKVVATHAFTPRSVAVPTAGAGSSYLSPGVPIDGDGGRIGLAAVVAIRDVVHLVTCGHAFGDVDGAITTKDGGTAIGALRLNLFTTAAPLDAAIFEATDDAIELLQAGAQADGWSTAIHEPDASDNGCKATFWPTWRDGVTPFEIEIDAYSSCAPATTGCGSILSARCTTVGDSGSSLQLDGAYYGIASRRAGNFSFFTPIASVKRRIEQQLGTKVLPWSPT